MKCFYCFLFWFKSNKLAFSRETILLTFYKAYQSFQTQIVQAFSFLDSSHIGFPSDKKIPQNYIYMICCNVAFALHLQTIDKCLKPNMVSILSSSFILNSPCCWIRRFVLASFTCWFPSYVEHSRFVNCFNILKEEKSIHHDTLSFMMFLVRLFMLLYHTFSF